MTHAEDGPPDKESGLGWIIPVGVVAAVAIAAISYRRFIERRYEDIYSGEGPALSSTNYITFW